MSGRRVPQVLAPDVLRWARERAGITPERLAAKIRVRLDQLRDWESYGKISLAQADQIARHTCTPSLTRPLLMCTMFYTILI